MAIKFKRSGSFFIGVTYTPSEGEPPNLLGYTVTSQLMDSCGVRHPLDVSVDETGLIVELTATAAATAEWSVGEAQIDVRYQLGTVFLTDTLTFPIIPQITLS